MTFDLIAGICEINSGFQQRGSIHSYMKGGMREILVFIRVLGVCADVSPGGKAQMLSMEFFYILRL